MIDIKWRPYQEDYFSAIEKAKEKGIKRQLIVMATGCHAKGTKILMYDGTVKNVEEIIKGEFLMGNDSTPRKVLSLIKGNNLMYQVTPVKGEPFTVNEDHILSLKRTGPQRRKGYPNMINIPVKEYLKKTIHFKHLYKLYRTGVDFPYETKLPKAIKPYWLGLWIGDGTFSQPQITNEDKEVLDYLNNYKLKKGYKMREYHKGNGLWQLSITKGKDKTPMFRDNDYNMFLEQFRNRKEKVIPHKYLLQSTCNRLELLAGLLDSDGSLSCNGYDFINKSENISKSVVFLARSLGLAAYITKSIKGIKSLGFKGTYWRVSIIGHTNIIPCKIKRKQATKRKQKKDVLITGFKLKKLEVDTYYGFELDGNHLYCMGDFTVTHNTGKRLLAVGTSLKYKRTLFLCHREELIEQAYEDFYKLYPMDVGIVKGKRFEIDKKIVIASAQTIWRRLDRIPEDWFDCVMADEVHHYLAKTFIKPLEYFKYDSMYGYTATPTRLDGLNFTNIVDSITYEYSIESAIKEGFLCRLEAYRIQTEIDISKVKRVGGDFNNKELSRTVDIPERNRLIVNKYMQYGSKRQGIVFCAGIQHAVNVRDMFREFGINAETISSKTDPEERRMLNLAFKNGNIQILTNVNILTEGWDYADVGVVMMARPTQSLSLYMQMLGRGTRLKTNKHIKQFIRNDCTILDFVDNAGNHKLVNHWTIEKDKKIDERVLISDEQKAVYKDKIEKLRQAKIKNSYKHDKKLNLFRLPNRKRIRHVGRLLELATEKQLKWLKDLGVWQENVEYTKGQASEFITNSAATPWMLDNLKKWNFKVKDDTSMGQYYEAKVAYKERMIELRNSY